MARDIDGTLEQRLRAMVDAPAANTDRSLFQELNPQLPHSPILSAPPKKPRAASVLIPILKREDLYTVLLTVRAPTMPSHAGEIGFPGGGPKGDDTGPISTALREAHEEVGIAPSFVDVLGTFGTHFGGLGYAVTPVVGLVPSPPPLDPCDREVAEAFEVPLGHFIDPDNHLIIDRQMRDSVYKMFAVPYDVSGANRNIWGLTAGIIHTFMCAWNDLPASVEDLRKAGQ